ncbi:hypothetical protein [Actinotignum urinale]|uniref:hypothetical protein n=1 Tax=Actinotignum urinale TaxID=190146 RepID=UPI00370DB154
MCQKHLFSFLAFTPSRERTTNPVEAINQIIRRALDNHRGISEKHMITMINWICYQRSEFLKQIPTILKEWDVAGQPQSHPIPPKKTPPPTTPEGAQLYGNTPTTEEGLWPRKGWAGRTT